jgi:P-type E1-E2 ATPase
LTKWETQGKTVILFSKPSQALALFALADRLRPEAAAPLKALHRLEVKKIVILIGDHSLTAKAVTDRLQIGEVHAGTASEQNCITSPNCANRIKCDGGRWYE